MNEGSVSEAAIKIVDETAQGVLGHLMTNEVGTPRHLSIERAEQVINQVLQQETRVLAERAVALEVENASLKNLINAEIMPRYMELFDATGLGSSVVPDIVNETLSQPTPTTGILELASAGYKLALILDAPACPEDEKILESVEHLSPEVKALLAGDCAYCDSTGTVETDNNGPIVACPICQPPEESKVGSVPEIGE